MNIIHYTPTNYESGSFGGVARFDYELRKAIPEVKSVLLKETIDWSKLDPKNTVIITDHSYVHRIPIEFKVIGVHHGCAVEHKIRNNNWKGDGFVTLQKEMNSRPNTYFVGTSEFTRRAIKFHHNIDDDIVILHSVDTSNDNVVKRGNSVVGDWRTESKGSEIIEDIKIQCPEFTFNTLKCGKYDKLTGYKDHNIYMCLSYHEGIGYAILDALACGLPVLSTTAGLFDGDYDPRCGEVIHWQDRHNVNLIKEKLLYIYENYQQYDPIGWVKDTIPFSKWKQQWKEYIHNIL